MVGRFGQQPDICALAELLLPSTAPRSGDNDPILMPSSSVRVCVMGPIYTSSARVARFSGTVVAAVSKKIFLNS